MPDDLLLEPHRKPGHWYHDAGWLVVLILFALGPLAIPLVWTSPRIGRRTKIVLTVVALAYTALTVGATLAAVERMREMLRDAGIELSLR